jgi:hypothetical protein
LRSFYLWLWLCILVCLSSSSNAVDCTTDTIGLCTPGVTETIIETVTETVEHKPDGVLTTTETIKDITTTTVANENSGDILDSDNGYVVKSKDGSMQTDWGGQGPASMPTGDACGELNVTKCAMITGSGDSTSTMGVEGMGTTFIQTVNISDLNIKHGGQANYEIRVDKQDASDSIYMHITGKDGNTDVFSGTDILSASGTASGYQTYESSFNFAGSLTTVIIEIGGRDINLAIGPMFSNVSLEILYNTINTIISQEITTVEMFVALNIDAPEEIINIVEDIFDSNDMVDTDEGMTMEPIEMEEVTYETVETEMAEMIEMEMPEIEIEVAEIEIEIEAEIEAEIETTVEETIEEKMTELEVETKEVEKAEVKEQPKKEESAKEKAGKKIVKSMDDKKRYDATNQLKTLIVMQVLGDSKSFFQSQKLLEDRQGFFDDAVLADGEINYNLMGQYLLFVGSDGLHNEMVESQWRN